MSERTRVYGVTLAAAAAVCPVRPLTRVSVALLSSIFWGGLFLSVRARARLCIVVRVVRRTGGVGSTVVIASS